MLGLTGWFGISAWQAKQEAESALTAATGIRESISAGDMDALDEQITELTDHVHGAYAQTSSTIWTLASHIPYIGVDVTAVRTVVTALENICVQAMPGLQDALRAVNGIQVENGTMSIQEFAPPPAEFTTPVVTLTAEERALFTDKLARVPQDVNFTPDFPRTGEIAQTMWQQSTQQTVDGVIAIDPVFLQRMLAVSGPVTMSDGSGFDGITVHDGLTVGTKTITLGPGESYEIVCHVQSAPGVHTPLTLVQTPQVEGRTD